VGKHDGNGVVRGRGRPVPGLGSTRGDGVVLKEVEAGPEIAEHARSMMGRR
jgi:hypothetical protein